MIKEKLTKLDVARRQIDEAIRMFFERRDTVSTHTVASAASQVLADFGKGRFQGWTRNKAIVNKREVIFFTSRLSRPFVAFNQVSPKAVEAPKIIIK